MFDLKQLGLLFFPFNESSPPLISNRLGMSLPSYNSTLVSRQVMRCPGVLQEDVYMYSQ